MPKKLIYIILAILVVLVVLSLAKDILVEISVEKGVSLVTGMKLDIRSLRVSVPRTLVHVKGLRLYNPPGYKDRLMMDMPEIYVDYDLPAFLEGRVHLYEMRMNLKELLVVKNEKGELNLDSLAFIKEMGKGGAPGRKGKLPRIQVDNFRLVAGKAVYKDYTTGKEPSVNEYIVDIDQEYHNIGDLEGLMMLVVAKTMAHTSIAQLTGFDLRGLEKAVENMGKALNNAVPGAGDTINGTVETLKSTTQKIGGVLMSPFSAKKE